MQHDPYTCDCAECQFDAATQSYYEILAETGSSAFMLYGNASDANRVAAAECGAPPTRADFGLPPIEPRSAPKPSPVDPDDIPF